MRPIVFNILLMLLLCRIGTEVSVAQTVEPLKDRGDVLHVACLKEGAELRSEADITAQVVENVAWMTHYVAVETKTDSTSRNWVKVGKYISLSEAEPVGWMLKDHLLMRMEANKKEGIYEKAIVVVHYDRQNRAIGGAPVRRAPLKEADPVGQDLTLFNIFHIYDQRNDVRADQVFFLLGDEAQILDPQKPGNTLVGWVNRSQLFLWNTREAAEYDKSTLGQRNPVQIYEHEEELKNILLGETPPNAIDPLAKESKDKTEIHHADPRFPIITKEREVNKMKMWHVGFIGDEIEGPGVGAREKVAQLSRLPNEVDIIFVFDGTGSMRIYKESVIGAVKQIQLAARDFWQEHYPGESEAKIRYSVAMYKDYSEPDYYKRLPLEEKNESKIEQFLRNHAFSGGHDQPAVFNGLSSALLDTIPEMSKDSFHAVFLIGDMGNLGDSDDQDPEGHTTSKMVDQLKAGQCDFYAIHAASAESGSEYVKFEREAKAIRDQLPQGFAEYIPLTDVQRVKEEIYDKIIELLDQRYQLPQVFKDIAKGRILLGKSISGTILEQRAIDIMKRHGLSPEDFARRGVAAFAQGWVSPDELNSGKRAMKQVILMNKNEVETLIAILGRLARVKPQTVQQGWQQALRDVTGDKVQFDPDKGVPAEIINKHLGVPVKSGVLNMTFEQIGLLPTDRITEEVREFKTKLFLLRAVVNEREIEIKTDPDGEIIFSPTGDKQYWFGTRGSERVWLDAEVYLP